MSVKGQVLEAIQRLPDDIDFRYVADEIALLAALQEAERDIERGRLISNEEMKSRIGLFGPGVRNQSSPAVLISAMCILWT
jgi:predicted transcriptional regulator